MSEKVLVAPKGVLRDFIDFFGKNSMVTCSSVVTNFEKFVLHSDELLFLERENAETNPSFLQLIPYCLVKSGDKYFRYVRTRKGGDGRLHDKHSLGIGGHVNDSDGPPNVVAYVHALWREIEEELCLPDEPFDKFAEHLVGLIYNPVDEVGQVHFGVLHVLELPEGQELVIKDAGLAEGHWDTVENIRRERGLFEEWSKAVIDHYLGGQG